jgi:hypothetical protein
MTFVVRGALAAGVIPAEAGTQSTAQRGIGRFEADADREAFLR